MAILITILFLLILNGFFSLSEMAIVSCNKALLRDMFKRGNKGAGYVLQILENQGKFLSTIQVGITAVGTLAAAYGGATAGHHIARIIGNIPFVKPYAEGIAITFVVILLTYVSVIIGELIPKRIALRNPENISIIIARPMLSVSAAFSPLVKILDYSAEVVMRFFGILGNGDDKVTEDELKAMLSEGAESGVIEKSEHEMMQRIFLLDSRDAKSIMTHVTEVSFIKLNDDISEIRRKVKEAGHSRYPVMNDAATKVVGVVQAKELLWDALSSGSVDVKAHLQEVHFISENTNCLKVLEMFKASSIHLAIVLDEYGATEGIVTASDIFEAVVGLLPSNYDEQVELMIRRREDGSWLVNGMTPIDEINILIGIEEINDENEGKFDTIAGFVLDNLERIPQEGDKLIKYGYEFEILDMDSSKVDKLLISKITK